MIDIAPNPRITQLLGRIETLRAELDHQRRDAREHRELAGRMASLHEELGRYVHWLMRQEPAALRRIYAEAQRWAQEADQAIAAGTMPAPAPWDEEVPTDAFRVQEVLEDLDDGPALEPLDELGSVGSASSDEEPMSLDLDDLPALPEAEPSPARSEQDEAHPALSDADVEELTDPSLIAVAEELEEFVDLDDEDAFDPPSVSILANQREKLLPAIVGHEDDDLDDLDLEALEEVAEGASAPRAAWLFTMQEVLDAVGQADPTAGVAPEVSTQHLTRALTSAEDRWRFFPPEAQSALVHLTAAVAQACLARKGDLAELRLHLGRLHRFADEVGLPPTPVTRYGGAAPPDGWDGEVSRAWAGVHRVLSKVGAS